MKKTNLSKLSKFSPNKGDKSTRGEEVRLLVPNQLCGALIGRNGETIRNFINDSQVGIDRPTCFSVE